MCTAYYVNYTFKKLPFKNNYTAIIPTRPLYSRTRLFHGLKQPPQVSDMCTRAAQAAISSEVDPKHVLFCPRRCCKNAVAMQSSHFFVQIRTSMYSLQMTNCLFGFFFFLFGFSGCAFLLQVLQAPKQPQPKWTPGARRELTLQLYLHRG